MKKLSVLSISAVVLLASCRLEYEHNAAGMMKLQQALAEEFGNDAYYTSIGINAAGDETQGYIVRVEKSADKESIRNEVWIREGGSWINGGVANMQIDARTAGYYKFQLNKEVNLEQLGALIDSSKVRFTNEQKGNNPILKTAIVNTNNTVTDSMTKYRYTVILHQSGNPETHSYTYDRAGTFMISN